MCAYGEVYVIKGLTGYSRGGLTQYSRWSEENGLKPQDNCTWKLEGL
jgi:hypothetical protein